MRIDGYVGRRGDFNPGDIVLGSERRTPEQITQDRATGLRLTGQAKYLGIRGIETRQGPERAQLLNKMAGVEATNIRHQLEADPKSRTASYDWKMANDVSTIAQRLEVVASGGTDPIAQSTFRDATAQTYLDTANTGDNDYVSNGSEQGPKRYLAKAKNDLAEAEIKTKGPYWETLPKEKVLERLVGFGLAALGENDIETAIEAFTIAGSLKDPEVVNSIQAKIVELKQSEDPELKNKGTRLEQAIK